MAMFAPGVFTNVPDTLDVAGKHIVGFARLSPEVAAPLRLRMIGAANDCGCAWGGGASSAVLSVYLFCSLLAPMVRNAPTSFSWWWALAAMLGGWLIGKTFGTFRAKRALDTAIEEFNYALARAGKS